MTMMHPDKQIASFSTKGPDGRWSGRSVRRLVKPTKDPLMDLIPRYMGSDKERIDLDDGRYFEISCPYDQDSDCDFLGKYEHRSRGYHGPLDTHVGRTRMHDSGVYFLQGDRDWIEFTLEPGRTVSHVYKDLRDMKYGKAEARRLAEEQAADDVDRFRRWINNQWHFIGVVVTLFDEDGEEISSDSLWSIEDDTDYWREVAAEMMRTLLDNHDAEKEERTYWAERDVITA